jgi:hypothetical protein
MIDQAPLFDNVINGSILDIEIGKVKITVLSFLESR